jgi:predicted kinase
VYQEVGISLPDWVRRTEGFTRDVASYDQARDAAYARMLSLLEEHLTAGAPLVIVDAVHGESAKRSAVFDVCVAHEADPLLFWCRCEDHAEIERRLSLRRGRESEPECEASDWSVFEHLARRWEAPSDERCGSNAVPVLSYDTWRGKLQWLRRASRPLAGLIEHAFGQGGLDGQGDDATQLERERGRVDRLQVHATTEGARLDL